MTTQQHLEAELYAQSCQTGRVCTIIVMHPKTWQILCEETFLNASMAINRHDPSLKYKGIRVLRSFDVVEGLFVCE